MKRLLIFCILVLLFSNCFASHIIGGEMRYEYIGPGAASNSKQYRIRLLLLKGDVANVADLLSQFIVGVFNNDNGQKIIGNAGSGPTGNNNWIALEDFQGKLPVPITVSPCITGNVTLDYTYKTYSFIIDLPNNNSGYTVAFQTYSRQNSNNVNTNQGATYSCIIPGLNSLASPLIDNAPEFKLPISVICGNSPFNLDFSATDADGDSLVYNFCNAFNGGNADVGDYRNPVAPPYGSVSYTSPYTAFAPLGLQASINPATGIISGIAPPSGKYVVCVCITVFRNGVFIATHRKDLIVAVNDCFVLAANPTFAPTNCESLTTTFTQASTGNPDTFFWDFGDPASGASNTSSLPLPTHTFTTEGVYNIKLVVSTGGQCFDSITKPIKVFPGFYPDFNALGKCRNFPIQFNDNSRADFGIINKWTWNFGDPTSANNTSTLPNPVHTYANTGSYTVTCLIESDKGCSGTVTKTIDILAQPPLTVIPKDTLICNIDTLQINAIGAGSFLWTPNYMISNTNIPDPLVSPDVTTTYHVQITDAFGCTGKDSLRVRVVNQVTQFAGPDTTICKTDPVILQLTSDALHYVWTENPAGGNTLNNAFIKNPTARPLVTTTYHVLGNIGKCIAENDIKITPIPYPAANAGPDDNICFGQSAQLNASGGSIYNWSPAAFLTATNIANPVSVKPTTNIRYIVTVRDVLGCPKPARDTMVVFVAKIKAYAGPSDTSVVLGQPLQLGASGSTNYSWSPTTWLNNPLISNPIALPQDDITYTVRVSNNFGCFDNASIRVHLFKIKPDLLVPNAFTPNGDGTNDIFKPIPIGMKSVDIFRVYNRWGQMVYSGSGNDAGWDGTFGGKKQEMATFVWYAEGVDYLNNKLKRKGSVVLIR
jgi:gliding motility-associated-like protein